MPYRIFLVRHGRTAFNVERRYQGQHDPVPLDEVGIRQARRLARYFAPMDIQWAISSDLQRAVMTAEEIARPRGLSLRADRAWREMHLGRWQGLTQEEVMRRWPEEYRRVYELRGSPQGGESYTALQRRVVAAFHRLAHQAQGSTVLVVTHGGPIRCLVCHLLGIPLSRRHRIAVANASVSLLEGNNDSWRLVLLNDVCHLA